jgi:hypothetical protein
MTVIAAVLYKTRMLVSAVQFHPSLIFAAKARSLPLEWYPVRWSTLVGFSLVHKH